MTGIRRKKGGPKEGPRGGVKDAGAKDKAPAPVQTKPARTPAPEQARSSNAPRPGGHSQSQRPPRRSGHRDADASARTPERTDPRPADRHSDKRTDRPANKPAAPAEPWDISKFQVPPVEGKTRFHDLNLPPEILHAIADLGFQYCTPIQAQILPRIIDGADVAGRSQTGTGKTAAFLISTFTHMLRNPIQGHRPTGTPRMLVLAPTRELVLQIDAEARAIARYVDIAIEPVFGGMDYNRQMRQLKSGPVDMIVATPGRLLDFVNRQRCINLGQVETLVIDEADRMLDMGFIPDVRTIVYSTPPKARRQTLFFSATLTSDVTRLAASWTRDPVTIQVEPEQVAAKSIDQIVYLATGREKFALLYNTLQQEATDQVLVFGNRRDVTDRLTHRLQNMGINCALLSGDVPQEKRLKTLDAFKDGRIRVLVATDVAGRGIHVEGISHVINYNLPEDPEDYVHRIGRTGRVGAKGTSISFACEEDSFLLPDIEKYLGQSLKCVYPDETLLKPVAEPAHSQRDPSTRGDHRRPHRPFPGGRRGAPRGGSSRGGSRGGPPRGRR